MDEEKTLEIIKTNIENEPYAKMFGIRVLELSSGHSVVSMEIKKEYNNIFEITHGGAVFSLLDVAFGAASNSFGTIAVALNINISYIKSAKEGDTLVAKADEIARSNKTASYFITVRNHSDETVAVAQTLAYLKKEKLPFLN
jgi:acyl-CoA thioesterase